MSDSTLAAIKKKVRRLTASPSPNQLSEADLEDYINTFYEQDLPADQKLWNLHDKFEFYTQANEDKYDFDTTTYTSVVKPVYIDGNQATLSQSRPQFFNVWPKTTTRATLPLGNGSAGPYAYTLTNVPVLKRDVTVSAVDSSGNTQVFYDVPQAASETVGDLIDDVDKTTIRGTINYVTGAISVTFSNTIAATQSINTSYVRYAASRPTYMLFFNDYFILRPVPDKVYKVTVEVYRTPTQLLSADNNDATNTPDVKQWWQYIAFGAAIKVLQDRQDMDSIANIMPFYREQKNLLIYRTATQQENERTATIYTDQVSQAPGRYFGDY